MTTIQSFRHWRCLTLVSMAMFISCIAIAQKASDVLERGKVICNDESVYLRYTPNIDKLEYGIGEAYPRLKTANDSLLILPHETEVYIYLFPLNPLKFSDSTSQVLSLDLINQEAANKLTEIIDMLTNLSKSNSGNPSVFFGTRKAASVIKDAPTTKCIDTVRGIAERITEVLGRNQKKKINDIFTALRNSSFDDSSSVRSALNVANEQMQQISSHFDSVRRKLDSFRTKVSDYNCDPSRAFIDRIVLNQMHQQFQEISDNQVKRYHNLIKARDLVDSVYKASRNNPENNFWYKRRPNIELTDEKICKYTLTIYESGYELSVDDEIIATKNKKKKSITLIARKFQRFVPEVAAGIAYVDLYFPKFGTATDSVGIMRVAGAGEELIRKMNFTAMINFNYFIPSSPVHPFYQLGIGINTGYPTLFTGIGLRSNIAGLRRIAIATGFASTWVKTLNQLQMGSPVSGTAELEKDITYEFSWPLKPYLSIQYNF